MLKKPTVLVLGAGASTPFGFPTGVKLSKLVIDGLEIGGGAFFALRDVCAYTTEKIIEFRDSFFYSGKDSVDAFLEHRPDYVPIGKAATAAVLIPFERSQNLFQYEKGNWLRYLYNNLNTSFDSFGSNQLSIVTFNYDRSVEHFLFTSLKNTYKKSNEESSKVLSQIPIIHLHGSLGHLPWQDKGGRPYSDDLDMYAIKAGIDGIKIIHEDIKDGRDKEFQRAKDLMAKAEQIAFMGFGYNRTNLERLGVANLQSGKIIGTCVGLGNQEKQAIQNACGRNIRFVGGDCLDAVREEINWD